MDLLWGLLILQSCYLISSQYQTPNKGTPSASIISPAILDAAAKDLREKHEKLKAFVKTTIDKFLPESLHQTFQRLNEKSKESSEYQKITEAITKSLMNKMGIPQDQCNSLSKVDLSSLDKSVLEGCKRTLNFKCDPNSPYRELDGSCNNLQHPDWGMANACHQRLLPANYSDGVSAPRKAASGKKLPLPRIISTRIHNYIEQPTDDVTHMIMTFGQFLDHGISLTPQSAGPNGQALNCCPVKKDNPPECDPIIIPKNDKFYGPLGITCLNNVRSAGCATCLLGPKEQTNQVTSFIDGSQVYDNSKKASDELRSKDGTGTLQSNFYNGAGELPPQSKHPESDSCSTPGLKCFEIGDQRANQNPALTALQTLFLREHNRIARRLKELNPGWKDEKLFQEARRIVIAELQIIVYNEFLPALIGPDRMEFFHLNIQKSGFSNYDPKKNPQTFQAFIGACFRVGHSLINGWFLQVFKDYSQSYIKLENNFQNPFGLYQGQLDAIVNGLRYSPAQKYDRFVVEDVTNHLYQNRKQTHGLDLVSLNLLRIRDHGIQGYTKYVVLCGGPVITDWSDLERIFKEGLVSKFRAIYERPEDIDLFSGGLAEYPNKGALIGPTFTCVIGIQFYNWKYGDRFYFEHGGQAGSFTEEQLNALRDTTTLGALICRNTENIPTIQRDVFRYPSAENPDEDCKDKPELDLRLFGDKGNSGKDNKAGNSDKDSSDNDKKTGGYY